MSLLSLLIVIVQLIIAIMFSVDMYDCLPNNSRRIYYRKNASRNLTIIGYQNTDQTGQQRHYDHQLITNSNYITEPSILSPPLKSSLFHEIIMCHNNERIDNNGKCRTVFA